MPGEGGRGAPRHRHCRDVAACERTLTAPALAPPRSGPGAAAVAGLLALGAGVTLLAASRPWVQATVEAAVGLPQTTLQSSGNAVGPVSAVALVALAAAGGLLAARSALRRAVAVLATVAGGVLVALALRGADRSARAAELASTTGGSVHGARLTVWPFVALVGGLIVLAAGLAAARWSGSWAGLGARYDGASPAGTPARGMDAWTALDRGLDPTLDPTLDQQPPTAPHGAGVDGERP